MQRKTKPQNYRDQNKASCEIPKDDSSQCNNLMIVELFKLHFKSNDFCFSHVPDIQHEHGKWFSSFCFKELCRNKAK